jgi:hypothetical protein
MQKLRGIMPELGYVQFKPQPVDNWETLYEKSETIPRSFHAKKISTGQPQTKRKNHTTSAANYITDRFQLLIDTHRRH